MAWTPEEIQQLFDRAALARARARAIVHRTLVSGPDIEFLLDDNAPRQDGDGQLGRSRRRSTLAPGD